MAGKRFRYFNTMKWIIFPCSLIPILFNMLTLLCQTSTSSHFRTNTYFVRLDFQDANLSDIIHFTDGSLEGQKFLDEIPLNVDFRRSYSFALLGYCYGTLENFDIIGEEYHVQHCTSPSLFNGFPLRDEMFRVFQTYILPSFPTAVFEFPKEFDDDLDRYDVKYKTMAGLSVAAIFLSSLSSITYIFSLLLISHTYIVGVVSSMISTVFLLCNAIINVTVNSQIRNNFESIDYSFETDFGDVIYVFNWLAFAFQGLVVALLLTMWSIKMNTFENGVKVSINDPLNQNNGPSSNVTYVREEPKEVKFKFNDALNTNPDWRG